MVEVVREFTFEAAHYLPDHPGKCRELHGHTYKLQVGFRGEIDPETGMVMDFSAIKSIIDGLVISRLDHKFLNNVSCEAFPREQPTAERMVGWIVRELNLNLPKEPTRGLSLVRLYETPTSYAEWRPEKC